MEKDKDGMLPLHWACCKNAPVEVVNVLLKARANGEAAFAGWDEEGLWRICLNCFCAVLFLKLILCVSVTVTGVGRRNAKEQQ